MGTRRLMAIVAAASVLAACSTAADPTAGPASPTSTSSSATPEVSPIATAATLPPTIAPTGSFSVECGPLADDLAGCLHVLAVAGAGLAVEHPSVEGVFVWPSGDDAVVPLPTPLAGAPTVEIRTLLTAYRVEFRWSTGWEVVPVYRAYDGWTAGIAPAATREYAAVGGTGTEVWVEPVPFQLPSGIYRVSGECSSSSEARSVTIVLQGVGALGAPGRIASRQTCPTDATSANFGADVAVEGGLHRLLLGHVTGQVRVEIAPIAGAASTWP